MVTTTIRLVHEIKSCNSSGTMSIYYTTRYLMSHDVILDVIPKCDYESPPTSGLRLDLNQTVSVSLESVAGGLTFMVDISNEESDDSQSCPDGMQITGMWIEYTNRDVLPFLLLKYLEVICTPEPPTHTPIY